MPFVDQAHRAQPDPSIPGDRCYVWYRWMMKLWREERRWTTADHIYAYVMAARNAKLMKPETIRALDLAWQVFFQLQVMPYEEEKRKENGEIE